MDAVGRALGARAWRGEKDERFWGFVNSHRDRAVRMAWRLIGGDTASAEDVAQEAFCKAYGALGRFREDSGLATWFYRILVNEAHKYRRWRDVRERWTALWPGDVSTPSPAPLPDPGLQRHIAQALDRLPRGQRDVFVLVYLEGFTVEEAAQHLGKAVGTVKSHLHRALVSLRGELAEFRDVRDDQNRGGER